LFNDDTIGSYKVLEFVVFGRFLTEQCLAICIEVLYANAEEVKDDINNINKASNRVGLTAVHKYELEAIELINKIA
jgi:hypothetical protein